MLNKTYPGRWRCRLQDVVGQGDRVITEVEISDGTHAVYAISFFTLAGGKIVRAREFFADCVEPPFDRSEWTERY